MRNPIRIVLTLYTWEILGESLLELLPDAKKTAIEVIVAPSPIRINQSAQLLDEESLYSKLKGMEARLQAQYPYLTFSYENIREKRHRDALQLSSSLFHKEAYTPPLVAG